MVDPLFDLTAIANRPAPSVADVEEACRIIADTLGAADAYVIRAGDPDFIRLGCACLPGDYEIKQKGYWLVWRQLVTNPEVPVGAFEVADRLVRDGRVLEDGQRAGYLAAILPGDESNSELLIVRRPPADGSTADQLRFLVVARTILSHLVSNVLDAERRTRKREQLEALADVSRAFNEARETDHILTEITTALAKASGFDWVTIAMFDDACSSVVDRAMNTARHSSTETAAVFREGRGVRDGGEVQLGVALARRRTNIAISDVFAADLADQPSGKLIGDALPFLQKYWGRAHILSIAMLPIMFQEKAIGIVHFSSSTKRSFAPDEVDFLTALVSQAATALKGVRLYDELEQSRDELRASEERFRSLVQNSSDLITILDVDGTLKYASPSVERLMGYRPEEWMGTNMLTLVHPEDMDRAANSLAAVIDEPGAHPPLTLRVRHNDGSWRYIEMTANNLIAVPSISGVVFNARDVTERWLAENLVRESEERFRSLVQNASDLITVIDADTTIRYQSPSIERTLGYDSGEIIGQKLSDLVHIDDVARTLATLNGAMNQANAIVTLEVRVRHRDNSWRHIELIGTDQCQNAAIGGFVLNMRDVSERKSLEQQLRYQALHDPLTKLANRTRFADRLEHALLRSGRTGNQVAVLFMDLDNFKGVNDSLGHTAGDKLLTEVAERVEACVRPGDTVARLGGDEFAILIDDVQSAESAVVVTQRVFEAMDAPFVLEGKELLVRASVGIAINRQGGQPADADSLLRDADVAMYVAKSHGKARYEIFDESMKVSMMDRLELLADLQRAVERREFVLQYQPIFLIGTGELYGLEALVRWNHPRRGLIPPTDFISLAEESGAIIGLGRWVLHETCRQAAAWCEEYPRNSQWAVSVNVSVKQLQHAGFLGEVEQVLRDSRLDPHRLILEITESVMMQEVPSMMERLRDLKQLGLRLAIDDFGTGYSSLSYLREFPFDLLKIDKAFIDDVGSLSGQKDLTSAIIELGKTLKLDLVAEGIERGDQVARLKSMECELGQGFYFARPLDADAVGRLLVDAVDDASAA